MHKIKGTLAALLAAVLGLGAVLAGCNPKRPSKETIGTGTYSTTPATHSQDETEDDETGKSPEPPADRERLKVVASFHAVAELTKAVAGDKVELSTVVPGQSEAHGFEPKPKDLESLQEADLFIYNGLGMEGWVDRALDAVDNPALKVVDTSEHVDLLPIGEEDHDHEHGHDHDHDDGDDGHDHDEDAEEHDHHGHHHHGPHDPHIWLGLTTAMQQVRNIEEALSEADPANRETYAANSEAFQKKMGTMLDEAREALEGVEPRLFVTGHAAFGYLARDLHLEQVSVQGVFAEGEPGAQKLAELVDIVRDAGVKTVFMEHLASPAVSETLAKEVGAEVQTIYTMESEEDGLSFLERVEANLHAITDSLRQD